MEQTTSEKNIALRATQIIVEEMGKYQRKEDEKVKLGLKNAADRIMQELYFGRENSNED